MKKLSIIIFIILLLTTITACSKIIIKDRYSYDLSAIEHYLDIPYSDNESNSSNLDVYLPSNKIYENTPVVVYVHGGSWIIGDKNAILSSLFSPFFETLISHGYAVISINYTLLNNKYNFPTNIIDVKDAIRWVKKNAATYQLDENNIGLWGTSAGAHLALFIAYENSNKYQGDPTLSEYSSSINYVIDFYGPTNLQKLSDAKSDNAKKEVYNLYFGLDYQNDVEQLEGITLLNLYSPINYVTSSSAPTLLVQGINDQAVPKSQSDRLFELLHAQNNKHKYIQLKNVSHSLSNITDIQLNDLLTSFMDFITTNYAYE